MAYIRTRVIRQVTLEELFGDTEDEVGKIGILAYYVADMTQWTGVSLSSSGQEKKFEEMEEKDEEDEEEEEEDKWENDLYSKKTRDEDDDERDDGDESDDKYLWGPRRRVRFKGEEEKERGVMLSSLLCSMRMPRVRDGVFVQYLMVWDKQSQTWTLPSVEVDLSSAAEVGSMDMVVESYVLSLLADTDYGGRIRTEQSFVEYEGVISDSRGSVYAVVNITFSIQPQGLCHVYRASNALLVLPTEIVNARRVWNQLFDPEVERLFRELPELCLVQSEDEARYIPNVPEVVYGPPCSIMEADRICALGMSFQQVYDTCGPYLYFTSQCPSVENNMVAKRAIVRYVLWSESDEGGEGLILTPEHPLTDRRIRYPVVHLQGKSLPPPCPDILVTRWELHYPLEYLIV